MSNSNQITKALYERAACWLADVDNPEDFYEDFAGSVDHSKGYVSERVKLEAEAHLKEEAFDIMYEIYQIYSNSDGGRN